MAKPRFPVDLREFLKLLNSARVEYLLIGGYDVGLLRLPAAANLDIWVAISEMNAGKLVRTLKRSDLTYPIFRSFLRNDSILRFGEPPLRIEILHDHFWSSVSKTASPAAKKLSLTVFV